jgi:hypothetical protein
LLRLRNFTLGKKISDADVLSEDGIEKIALIIGALVPWVCDSVDPVVISYARLTFKRQVSYLNSVVMPDPVTADADEDSESD